MDEIKMGKKLRHTPQHGNKQSKYDDTSGLNQLMKKMQNMDFSGDEKSTGSETDDEWL
jgi:hypothetical protein